MLASWMRVNAEAIHGADAGLEPWQFYGPSTRRGDRVYLFLLQRPHDTVTVRGLPIRRVQRVTDVASGQALAFRTRTGVMDQLQADPHGEVIVDVAGVDLDQLTPVLALDVDARNVR